MSTTNYIPYKPAVEKHKIPWRFGSRPPVFAEECREFASRVASAPVPSVFMHRQNLWWCRDIVFPGRRVLVTEVECDSNHDGIYNEIKIREGDGTYFDLRCSQLY